MTGEWAIVLEYLIVLNLPIGPWDGQAYYWKIYHTARSMQQSLDSSCVLFQDLYGRICSESRTAGDLDFGSEGHMQRTWESLWAMPVFHRQSKKVKLCRWMSFWDALDDLCPCFTSRLLVQIVAGIRDGLWADIEESPLMNDFAKVALDSDGPGTQVGPQAAPPTEPPPGGDAPGAAHAHQRPAPKGDVAAAVDAPQGLRNHEKELVQQARKKCKNTLHFATLVMGSSSRRQRVEVMRCLVQPIRMRFVLDQTLTTTIAGCREYHISSACGAVNEVALDIWACLASRETAQRVEFVQPGEVTTTEISGVIEQEAASADRMLRLACNLVGRRLISSMHGFISPPGKFAGLLSESPNEIAETLTTLSLLWSGVQAVERVARTGPAMDSILDELGWPRWVFVRECFIALEASDFLHIPDALRGDLELIFSGMNNTRIVENGFRVLRGAEEHSTRKQLCRQARWRRTQVCDLFGQNGREVATPDLVDKTNAASTCPATTFEAEHSAFSLGPDVLKGLANPSWKSQSVESHHLCSMLSLALRNKYDQPEVLRALWLNELFAPATCVWHVPSDRPYLVVSATRFGALLWLVSVADMPKVGGGTIKRIVLSSRGRDDWQWHHVGDLSEWRAFQVRPLPPLEASMVCAQPKTGCLTLILDEPGSSVLECKAKSCFEGLTVKVLDRLFSHLDIPRQRPRGEGPLLRALLSFIFPKWSQGAIQEILALRGKKSLLDSLLFEGENLEDVSHLLDSTDLKDAQRERKEHCAKKRAKQAGLPESLAIKPKPAGGVSGGSASSSSSSSDGARKKQVPPDINVRSCTPTALKAYLPPVAGACVARDTRLHFRWVGEYPRPEPPHSHSKAFGKHGSEADQRAALMHVLAWMWEEHRQITGQACPWDLV